MSLCPSQPIFFLDLDGVCADFVGGVERLYGVPRNSLQRPGLYDLHRALGTTPRSLSNVIRSASKQGFWLELEPLPWAAELVQLVTSLGQTYFLTAPWENDPAGVADKIRWVNREFALPAARVIPSTDKWLLAGPNRYLIDDLPSHCLDWTARGGRSVLFPALHHNRASAEQLADPLAAVRSALSCWLTLPTQHV